MVASFEGGGGRAGPFEKYPVSEEQVRFAGDRLASFAGNVESLRGDVTAAHRVAQVGVAGLLSEPMVAASEPVARRAQRWLRSSMFAGGAVRLFGDGVAAYNRGIDDLNQRYWSAKANNFGLSAPDVTSAELASADAELLAALRREWHTRLEPALDDQADRVARLLDQGPDNADAVVELYAAGALPWTAPVMFQNVDFGRVPAQLPPGTSGTEAAELIRLALNGDASPNEYQEAMLLLQIVTNRAAHVQEEGGHLTTAEVGFLHDFYNELGEDIWRIPDYIGKDEHHWDAPALNPFGWFDMTRLGFNQDTREWMMEAMGTGLLALSNNQLWGPGLSDYDPMDPDSRYHLPETVISLVSDSPFDPNHLPLLPLVGRHDDFIALSRLLEHTPTGFQGGVRFSELVTTRVAEIAGVLQLLQDDDTWGNPEGWSEVLQPLLEVSTRNHEANYHLLTGNAAGPFVRPNQLVDLDDRQYLLQALYGFEWSDDGKAAAGLTDWISERADGAAQDGEYDPMATEAAAALIDLVTMTEQGEGHTDRVDMYDTLMESLAERTPEVARSFSRVAASHLNDFSEPAASWTGVEDNGSLTMTNHDMVRFLDLIATDQQAINGLSYAAGEYQHRLLAAGLIDEMSMVEVGMRSSQLDGLLAAARVNADLVGGSQRYENELAAYEEHMRYANYGKTTLTTATGIAVGASPLAPGGPVINAGLGLLANEVVNGLVAALEPDPGFDPGDILDQGRDATYAAYDYLNAMIQNDQLPEGFEVPEKLLQTAPPPYPGAQEDTPLWENGRPVLKPIHDVGGEWLQRLIELVGSEDGGIGGREYEVYRNHYDASDSYSDAVATNAEAHRKGLR